MTTTTDTPTRPGVLAKLALALGATLLAVLAAEALFRVLGPRALAKPYLVIPGDEAHVPLSEIAMFRPFEDEVDHPGPTTRFRPHLFLKGWYDRPQWDYFDESDCVDYVFNRWGLRDDDFELEKPPGEYRVVAIGDSFTFGVGAQQPDLWTEVVQAGLQERRGAPVEVINAGFSSGHRPAMYEEWITKDAIELDPDLVLVALCLNDLHGSIKMFAYRIRKPPVVLGGYSAIVNWCAKRWVRRGAPEAIPFHSRLQKWPEEWEEQKAALIRSRDVLAENGIRMVLVIMPMLSGLADEVYPYAKVHDVVHAFCEVEGIDVIDTAPTFLGRRDEDFWAHPTDQHPNDRGHRLIGDAILEALEID